MVDEQRRDARSRLLASAAAALLACSADDASTMPVEIPPGTSNIIIIFSDDQGYGIRVPFIARFPGRWPAMRVYTEAVSTLDVAATALALAGLPHPPELDGVDLTPFVTGEDKGRPHEVLYWRFWHQAAIRKGRWKLLYAGEHGRFLFDVNHPKHEIRNLYGRHRAMADELSADLEAWASTLHVPGLPTDAFNEQEARWYEHHFGYVE